MNKIEFRFRVSLVNGRTGYGDSTWSALCMAVGEQKATLISNQYSNNSPVGTWYAKNGVIIAVCETRVVS